MTHVDRFCRKRKTQNRLENFMNAILEENFELDPVSEDARGSTPLFRDPATGNAFRVSDIRVVVQWLMRRY